MGVISSIDVISYLKDRSPAEIDSSVAEDVMTPSTIHIEPTKTLKDAADIMVKKRIHRLVVLHPHKVAGNVPVGVLSATDLIKALNEIK
jgi:CBS domain-containing protein